jgi:hypothetical protein
MLFIAPVLTGQCNPTIEQLFFCPSHQQEGLLVGSARYSYNRQTDKFMSEYLIRH